MRSWARQAVRRMSPVLAKGECWLRWPHIPLLEGMVCVGALVLTVRCKPAVSLPAVRPYPNFTRVPKLCGVLVALGQHRMLLWAIPLVTALRSSPPISRKQAVRAVGAAAAWRRAASPAAAFTEEDCASAQPQTMAGP